MASGSSRARAAPWVLLVVLALAAYDRGPSPSPSRTPVPAAAPGAGGATGAAAARPDPGPWGSFFLGAWCGPRVTERRPGAWVNVARHDVSLIVRPLEDPGDRAANRALLAHLDSLAAAGAFAIDSAGVYRGPLYALVRDRAVDPDEATRPGWRARVREVVAAYRGFGSLGGYFLADEPRPADFAALATLAREFAAADSAHPAFVNLSGLGPRASAGEQATWRMEAERLIVDGRLRLFSFDAYPYRGDVEQGNYLLSLANAARVAHDTGAPFAAVLQFTGFRDVPAVTGAQADALGGLAVAYGACGLTWFTYWTPNPNEPDMHWRGGAIDYDGSESARAPVLGRLGYVFRILRGEIGAGERAVAHFGSLPDGVELPSERVPGVDSVSGGPCTLALGPGAHGEGCWLLVNRDVAHARRFAIHWSGEGPPVFVRPVRDGMVEGRFDAGARSTTVTLAPGQSALVERVERAAPRAEPVAPRAPRARRGP